MRTYRRILMRQKLRQKKNRAKRSRYLALSLKMITKKPKLMPNRTRK